MIPARFHQLRDRAMRQVDRVFAEPVLLKFNKDGVSDPARPPMEIEAILRVGGGKEMAASGHRTDAAWRTRINAQRAELHIDPVAWPGVTATIGDEVRALARLGQPWFEVVGVDDRSITRIVLQLGESA